MVVSRVLCAALLFLSLMATSACRPLNAPEHVAGIEGAENVESEHLALEPLDPETMFVSNPESKAIWERALAAEEIEQEEREQLFEDTLAFLEKAGPSRERFDLAIVIAQVVYGEQGEAEGKAYQRIVDIVSQSKDQDLVTRAQRLAGTARKLFLLDKELAVEGQTVDGEEFDWNKYRGKVVLLDFWGTWCGACIEELPNVKKNYELYHDRGFEVVGVAADTERSAVVDFLKKHELPWVTLFDPAGLEQPTAVRLGVTSTPTAFLVNGEGKVVSLDARGEELGLRLAELLGESKESPVNEGSTDAEPTANTQSPNIEIAKNSVDMKLKLIPAGEFLMGSPEADSAPSHEQPQHRVKITKPFLIGVYEVTQAEYKQVTGSNPSSAPRKSAEGVVEDTSRFAVDNVSWDAAAAFCNQLSELEGLSASYEIKGSEITLIPGDGYRLPTEAEWEYACRAGTTTRWCFGEDSSQLKDYAWFKSTGTHQVGGKKPNPFGLYDMYGNGWELCQDWYGKDYYKSRPESDPTGPAAGTHRVIRGGSWFNDPSQCRSASRDEVHPASYYDTFSFRVVRTP